MKKLWQAPQIEDIKIEDTETFGHSDDCDFDFPSGETPGYVNPLPTPKKKKKRKGKK